MALKLNLNFISVILFLIILFLVIYYKSVEKFNSNLIVIITAEDREADYINYHDINFKNYASKNGYHYARTTNCSPKQCSTYWCKIHKVKEFLDTDKYNYVMWADSDTIIRKPGNLLEDYIRTFDKDIIIGVDCTRNCKKNHILNAGVFIIKNSYIGKQFINECITTINNKPECIINGKEQGKWAGMCYEQGVMNELIFTKYKNNCYIDYNSDFVFNQLLDPDLNNSFILHLCNKNNTERNEIFKNIILMNKNL